MLALIRRGARRRPRATGAAAAGAATGAILLAYGLGCVGWDSAWTLIWSRDLAEGSLPRLDSETAPTPHPLSIALAVPLAALGDAAPTGARLASAVSMALLGYGAFRLGRALGSTAVGALAGLLVLTRPLIVSEHLLAYPGVLFAAVVVIAVALEVERPRRGLPVLALLTLAGLLRPEAWILAAAYALWLAWPPTLGRRRRMTLATWAAIAPAGWALFDLVATGDALYSWHLTSSGAGSRAAAGLPDALLAVPRNLYNVTEAPLLVIGAAGLGTVAWRMPMRSAPFLAAFALATAAILVQAAVGVPVLARYAILPGVLLCVAAAYAVLGWRGARLPAVLATRWRAAAAAAAIAVVGTSPWVVAELVDTRRIFGGEGANQAAASDLLDAARAREAAAPCWPVGVSALNDRAMVAWKLRRIPDAARQRPDAALAQRGSALLAPTDETPPGARVLARNARRVLVTTCPRARTGVQDAAR